MIGHRWYEARNLPVALPFGHGLGYTSFECSDIRVSPASIAAGDSVRVELAVRHAGARPGAEVVQVYDTNDAAAERHERVRATPFAATVPSSVPASGWTVVSGRYELTVGQSHAQTITRLPVDIRADEEPVP